MNGDLSDKMQMQCHRVSQKACDLIYGLLFDEYRVAVHSRVHEEDERGEIDIGGNYQHIVLPE
jgi:hypothetical protein